MGGTTCKGIHRPRVPTRLCKIRGLTPWTGASGDQSPHLWFHRKAAEERMLKLRGLTRLEEVSLCLAH